MIVKIVYGSAGSRLEMIGLRQTMSTGLNYDVKCMLCGTEVGQIYDSGFHKHPGCSAPLPRKGGMLRCCHCGGSLYLDPTDERPPMVDRAQIAEALAEEAA